MMDILKKQGKAVSSIFPKRFKFWHYIFLAASILFSLPASNAHSAQVTLAWDASTDSNTAGYKVHYGISSGSYQAVIDVGKTTTCTISNLPDGTTYYFAATDYNASGAESAYSNEVSYTTSATCTYSISPTSQSPGSSGGPGTVSVTASSGCSWTAMSNAPSWIAVTSNGSVTGNGTVNYSVSANSGTTSRTGTMTIAGKTFTVTQSGSSQYTLTINKSGTGTGSTTNNPAGTTFSPGTVVNLTATPGAGSTFAGWSGGYTGSSPTCSVTMNSNTSVTATFTLKTYTVTATSDTNGSISPSGSVTVNYGASRTFTITPNSGYQISDVKVDGTSAGATSSYTFGNVMSNHTIQATFSPGGSSAGKIVVALNTGGARYRSNTGTTYVADKYYSGGSIYGTTAAIAGTADAILYQSERFGNLSYSIPVANGNYTVTLKFAEIFWSDAGRRVFNVNIGGIQVISNLDIFAMVGENRAYDVAIPITVVNGILKIDFVTVVDNAKVSAILVQTR